MKQVNVAVVGATGAVGEAMIEILAERDFPVGQLHLLASERSDGKTVRFGGRSVRVKRLDRFDFEGVEIAFFSAGSSVSAEFAPKAAAAGCVVIDNTSQFRYDHDVPLVVPEVNPHAIGQRLGRGIIANPNCSTIQMVVALSRSTMRSASSASTLPRISRFPGQGPRVFPNWRARRPTC